MAENMRPPDVARAEEPLNVIEMEVGMFLEEDDGQVARLHTVLNAVREARSLVRDLARRSERSEEALDAAHIVCNAVEMGLPMHRIEAAVAAFRKTQVPSSPDATDDRSTR
jgi:hypothetical protein